MLAQCGFTVRQCYWVYGLKALALALVLIVLLLRATMAHAQDIQPAQVQFSQVQWQTGNEPTLRYQLGLQLSDNLQLALQKGMRLFITIDMLVDEGQWWLRWRPAYRQSKTWGLYRHPLLQEWRLLDDQAVQRKTHLADALAELAASSWAVPAHLGSVHPARVRFRLRLDTSLQSRPFLLSSFTQRSAWSFVSSWTTFLLPPYVSESP